MSKIPTVSKHVPMSLPTIMESGSANTRINMNRDVPLKPRKDVSRPVRIMRRSKSYTDLKTLPSQNLKPSTSTTCLSNPLNSAKQQVKASSTKPAPHIFTSSTTSRTLATGTRLGKRAAENNSENQNNKIRKQGPKIPDWDYKSRFNILTEKHSNLVETYNNAKTKLRDLENIEEENLMLKQDLARQTQLLDELRGTENKYNLLHGRFQDISNELDELKNHHNSLVISEKNLKVSHDNLSTQVVHLKGIEEAKDKLEVLYREIEIQNEFNEKELLNYRTKYNESNESNKKLLAEVDQLKSDLHEYVTQKRVLHNTIQDLKGNIRVFCRLRPPLSGDELLQQSCQFNFYDDTTIELSKTTGCGKNSDMKLSFTFDKSFPPETTQAAVFEELSHLVQSAMDGYHVCVFAYGQTGSGKTYTMQGDCEPDRLGMIPRTIDLIFELKAKLESQGWSYTVKASFLEIYNEAIKDLLNPKSKQQHEIRYNEGKGITVTHLMTVPIASALELTGYMKEAHRNRAVAATNFNEHSSRSHAVTKIHLEGNHMDTLTTFCGSINLVDLAGSESAKTSERINETKNINKSLSSLGTVMTALHNKDSHVPYRNSKLTYLLQSCLGGNSKTLMFVNIAPGAECFNESVQSLRFASKVKQVKNQSFKNKTCAASSSRV